MGSALSAENNVSYIVSSGSVVIDISVDAFDCFFFSWQVKEIKQIHIVLSRLFLCVIVRCNIKVV